MTRVVHCKKEKYDVYIGRPSILGTPFPIGVMTRSQVIDRYREYALKRMETDPEFKKALLACKDKVLGCWCHPLPCHGDVIKEIVDDRSV